MADPIEDQRDQLRRLAQPLLRRRTEVADELQAIPPQIQARRPAPDAWSLLDLLAHMMLAEDFANRSFAAHRRRPLGHSALDSLRYRFVRRVLAWGLRVKVPIASVNPPPQPLPLDQLMTQWTAVQDQLLANIAQLDAHELDACYFRHPVAGRFGWRQGLEFLQFHWDHHEPQYQRLITAARQS